MSFTWNIHPDQLKQLHEELLRHKLVIPWYKRSAQQPAQPLREVTSNGKRYLIIEDEHGEYFQAVSDVPATRDEGQGQP